MTGLQRTIDTMAKPLTDDEKATIRALIEQGISATNIAKQTGRSVDSVSRIAKSIGHKFAQSNLTQAHEARSAYCAERRALIAAKFTEAAEKLLDELGSEQYRVFNFGGKDNTYEEHELDSVPIEARRQMIGAAREAMRTVIDIDRHDNRDSEGLAAVDEWLRAMIDGAA